jgi:phosphatidylglycerol:prolipoprotein diacylglycerol transferase
MIALLAIVPVCALAGAKVYGIVERGGGWHGLSWELAHGYRYPGGILAALVAMPFLGRTFTPKVSLAALGDCAVVGVGVAVALARVGCFLAGCCHGLPSSGPWAVQFPAKSLPWEAQLHAGLIDEEAVASLAVHPLQLYFGVASVGVVICLLWYRSRQRYPGELLLLFFILDGTAKSLLESLRFEYVGHLQWTAAGSALVATVILMWREVRQKRPTGLREAQDIQQPLTPVPRAPSQPPMAVGIREAASKATI